MQKAWKCCSAVLGRVIFIGSGIQIALGILWMCSAFARLQGFGEGVVCAGQVVLAGFASYFFLGSFGGFRRCFRLFGSLALVTFPMVMQCHMASGLPSLLSSGLLLLAGGTLRAGAEWRFRGKGLCQAAVLAAVAGVVAVAVIFSPKAEDLESCAVSRFAWTTILDAYFNSSAELQDKIEYAAVAGSHYDADGIREVLAPYLRENYGEREAKELMRELATVAWQRNARRILKEIVWDAAGYAMAPAIVPLQMHRRAYDSYSGINYVQLLQPDARLGKRYMDYGCWWFRTGMVVAAVLVLPRLRRMDLRSWGVVLAPGCVLVLLYTMRGAGQMDYKNTIYLLYVWLAAMLVTAGKVCGSE